MQSPKQLHTLGHYFRMGSMHQRARVDSVHSCTPTTTEGEELQRSSSQTGVVAPSGSSPGDWTSPRITCTSGSSSSRGNLGQNCLQEFICKGSATRGLGPLICDWSSRGQKEFLESGNGDSTHQSSCSNNLHNYGDQLESKNISVSGAIIKL